MSKITITVSGPVGVGKSTVCAKLEILLKHLGCQVEWIGGKEEKNLMPLEDWTEMPKTPIEIVERVEPTEKVYETYSGQNGWMVVSQEEYDRTKGQYHHRIRRVPVQHVIDQCKEFGKGNDTFTYAEFGTAHELAKKVNNDRHLDMPVKQVFPVVGDPVGFMMKHLSGPDTGFSWNKNDPQFSQEWERIGLFSQEQMADAMRQMAREYNERAKKSRDAFEAMHRRAMQAEAKLLTQEQREAIEFAIGFMEGSLTCRHDVSVLKTIVE